MIKNKKELIEAMERLVVVEGKSLMEAAYSIGISKSRACYIGYQCIPGFKANGKRGRKPKDKADVLKDLEENYINGKETLTHLKEKHGISVAYLSKIGNIYFDNWREVTRKKRTGRPKNIAKGV